MFMQIENREDGGGSQSNKEQNNQRCEPQEETKQEFEKKIHFTADFLTDFQSFIKDNKIYIDKTEIIFELITKSKETALIVNGPRRTGKSLLLSTIQTIYTQDADWWKKYAKNLWITKNRISFFSANPYPIVRFSFIGYQNANQLKIGIIRALNIARKQYQLETEKILNDTPWDDLIQTHFDEVIEDLNYKFKKKVVLLIDENDQPLINQLFVVLQENTLENRALITDTLKCMSMFFTKIKDLCYAKVEIAVICGTSMIAQTSIYSGFNNAVYLREEGNPFFQTLLGFTQDEIKRNFGSLIQKIMHNAHQTNDQFWEALERYYNGYLPSPYATTRIYNPYSIQRYFESGTGEFKTYFANSGSTKQIFLILKQLSIQELNEFLQAILNENYMIPIGKNDMITRKEWSDFLDNFYQIAFDSGHLTYAMKDGKYFLKIPNEEMRIDFSVMIQKYLMAKKQTSIYNDMISFLEKKDFKGFFQNLELVTFENKSILNLKERLDGIQDQINYEVFLHQACSIAIKEMLINSKNGNMISFFEFINEKSPAEGNKSRFDSYFYIIWPNFIIIECIIEYKLLRNMDGKNISNAQEAINQIFSKKYYQKFKREYQSSQLFIIGVGFNPFDEKNIISEVLIQKYKGNDLPYGEPDSWEGQQI